MIFTVVFALFVTCVSTLAEETDKFSIPDEFTAVLGSFVGGETAPVKGSDGRWHVRDGGQQLRVAEACGDHLPVRPLAALAAAAAGHRRTARR